LSKFEPLRSQVLGSDVLRAHGYEGIFPTFNESNNCVAIEEEPAVREHDGGIVPTVTTAMKIQNNQQIINEAYQRGLENGKKEAQAECAREFNEHLRDEKQNCERLIENISKQFARQAAFLEVNAVKLAVAVADKIMKKEISIDGTVVLHQIRESLHRVWGVDMVKLRINPNDEGLVREHRTALLAGSDFIREVMIEADENVERGGCVIESSAGNVDARISTQLKQVEAVFLSQAPVIEKGSM
jgi:flagellar assembly protein FliH